MMKAALSLLCVVDRRNNRLTRALRDRGHTVLEVFTGDQGVALSVGKYFDAVILDQDLFIETDDWSLAQSFKLVRPSICVLLVARALHTDHDKPNGVDAVAPEEDLAQIIETLERLTAG